MADTHDTKFGLSAANSGQTSTAFNAQNVFADKIAEASPEAQAKIRDRLQLRDERYAKELNAQKYSRDFRIAREENRLMKDYILNDAPRPDSPEAKAQDLDIIAQEAEAKVKQREEFYLSQIEKQADADVRHMLSQGRTQSHTCARTHDEPEQGR